MSQLKQKWTVPTYLKYFFSYLLILCVFMAGTWFIIRKQMTDRYFEQRVDSAKVQLDYVAGEIKDNLLFLSRLDSSLITNETLQRYSYQESSTYHNAALKELKMYDTSSLVINNIVFMSQKVMVPISTQSSVTWKDNCFSIYKMTTGSNLDVIILDPLLYLDKNEPQLINLSDEKWQYLVYFPSLSSKMNCIFFYTLDINEMQSQMKAIISEEIKSVALIDSDGKIVKGENTSDLIPYTDVEMLDSGKYEQADGNFLCVSREILSGYRLVSLVDKSFLMHQISAAFASSYVVFLLLSVLGFLLIFVGMRLTYIPLRELTQRVTAGAFPGRYHLKQLEDTFAEVSRENLELRNKLDNYRSSIQRSLLDSLITTESGVRVMESRIDQFFDENIEKKIFIICLYSPAGTLSERDFRELIKSVIGEEENCIILERGKERAAYLINYIGKEADKAGRLKALLLHYYETKGCLSAISRSSESPMDIPALYENARYAGRSWPDIPVADGGLLSGKDDLFAYPYDKLNGLSQSLSENNFGKARDFADELFAQLDEVQSKKSSLQDYYVQNILLSMLINITNAMNQSNIEFDAYCNMYYETLYLCRSYSYAEKAEEIALNIRKMLDFHEKTNTQKLINSVPFKKAMEEGYCQPEFSISALAEQFGVSISYMSYQFKKEMNVTFSEYLWMLRLRKAKELLVMTDMSVDEIAIAVGYYSRTSFMKKFKQETGLTPSQYRMEENG